ncbi:MAG TPA: selenide, water dikinase SelD, partial [Candidatus Angelobacter sp.]|nr:selenide, water dikinase SelD [Candidatus Angelobacter sp.]
LDALILTKGLGTGVISTAIKQGKASQSWIDAATQSMTTLNAKAAEVAVTGKFVVHAATDITGFGLIGHAREMALGSGVSLRLDSAKVPLLDGALDCVRAGMIPGGLNNNRDFAECLVSYNASIPEEIRTILFDPQTAGGLLLSVARADTEALLVALTNAGVPAVEIGEVLPPGKPLIQIK